MCVENGQEGMEIQFRSRSQATVAKVSTPSQWCVKLFGEKVQNKDTTLRIGLCLVISSALEFRPLLVKSVTTAKVVKVHLHFVLWLL